MQTKTYNVYKFDELTEEQKEKAINNLRDDQSEFTWSSEYEASMQAFEADFPVKITNWSIDPFGYSYINFDFTDDEHSQLKGDDLRKHLYNHYFNSLWSGKYYGKLVDTLPNGSKIEKSKDHPIGKRHVKRYSKVFFEESAPTGFCVDYDLRKPIYEFLKSKNNDTTFEELIKDCLETFIDTWRADIEYQASDEVIIETIHANDYEFTSDGKIN
jgi:hypothetical protein